MCNRAERCQSLSLEFMEDFGGVALGAVSGCVSTEERKAVLWNCIHGVNWVRSCFALNNISPLFRASHKNMPCFFCFRLISTLFGLAQCLEGENKQSQGRKGMTCFW